MASIDKQLHEISKLNTLQQRDIWISHIHPLSKLLTTIIYVFFVVSIEKYQLNMMIFMAIYPFVSLSVAELSLKEALYRMRLILPLVMAVGIFNPIMDRNAIGTVGGVVITTGLISMITLMLKGLYTVLAAYVLIATTSIEDICYALRTIHVPRLLVTVILLIDRYIYILGEEADRIMTAYKLRAPSQKGIHYKAWGPLVGQWLIRSMDRAELVYESMQLRGFKGDFASVKKDHDIKGGVAYVCIWLILLAAIRFTNVVSIVSSLF